MVASDNSLGPASFRWAMVSSDAAIVAVNSSEHRPLRSGSYLNCLIANLLPATSNVNQMIQSAMVLDA